MSCGTRTYARTSAYAFVFVQVFAHAQASDLGIRMCMVLRLIGRKDVRGAIGVYSLSESVFLPGVNEVFLKVSSRSRDGRSLLCSMLSFDLRK